MSVKDNLSMEYEARAMIDENQYKTLIAFHKEHAKGYHQTVNINYYFDTDDRYLVNHHMVLRIREIKNQENELTLKIKKEKGDLEITHILSDKHKKQMLEKTKIVSLKIRKELRRAGVDIKKLKYITTLKTERLEIPLRSYLFIIDKNTYNNKVDYNIEVEAGSKSAAKKHLNELGVLVGVSYKEGYVSKSRRAILDL